MRNAVIITISALLAVGSCGDGDGHEFRRPGPRDVRGPCPMLNSLANHGWIPRSGKNVSIDQIVNGIDGALNLDPASSRPVAEFAATTSTTGNPNTLNLNDLSTHGVIEHDGSLSRGDIALGDNQNFKPKIYNTVAKFFTKDHISIETAAKARRARLTAAAQENPVFNFTAREDQFSQFETALYLAVWGKRPEWNAKTKWVDIMFREERIPYKEGFKRRTDVITNDDVVDIANKVAAAA
ncbi:Chloroperoxidase [Podospora aff. communis PSN243]|uniref:Chloroperoxidase n=1 Tax=Podospora aff. communis PSN243 TaxID=3040156 RepID=A0AAV9GM23_9PEZI|nr:Chloroperoxidase [Podospora aff. communis PSN243]